MKCPNCGKEIANDSVFCEYCGAKMKSAGAPMMSFVESIKTCFRKYVTFSGRATRAEFWWFWLPAIFVCIITVGWGLLVLLIPMITVGVRRCHDTNHSGWWLLFPVYHLVLLFTESDPGANDYGVLDA